MSSGQAATFLAAQTSSQYRITHTYMLGGEGSWDYVVPDPPNHRIFIARQNRLMVVDEDKGTLLGEVTGINGAHGAAIAASSGHGFATSGNDQSVVMFDAKTFQSLKRIPAAEGADAIVYDPPSDRVFTLNGDAHSSTVIDSSGNLVTKHLARRKTRIWSLGRRWQRLRESHRHERGCRDRFEGSESRAPLVHWNVQAARIDGDRYGTSSALSRFRQVRTSPGRRQKRDSAPRLLRGVSD